MRLDLGEMQSEVIATSMRKKKKKREFTDVHVLVLAASNSDAGNDKEYYYTLPFCVSLAFYFMMIV